MKIKNWGGNSRTLEYCAGMGFEAVVGPCLGLKIYYTSSKKKYIRLVWFRVWFLRVIVSSGSINYLPPRRRRRRRRRICVVSCRHVSGNHTLSPSFFRLWLLSPISSSSYL